MTDFDLSRFPYKVILWDFDNTLLLTEPMHAAAVAMTAQHFGVNGVTKDIFYQTRGLGYEQTFNYINQRYQHDCTYQEWENQVFTSYEMIAETPQIRRGVLEAIMIFEQKGLTQAVISNSIRRFLGPMMNIVEDSYRQAAGRALPFTKVLAVEDCPAPKPDPRGYLQLVKSLTAEPGNCLAIEDSASGIGAAEAAGIPLIAWPEEDERDIRELLFNQVI